MDRNVIYNEDCMERMARMEDGCVDLIVTDPPYSFQPDGGGGAFGSGNKSFRGEIAPLGCGITDDALEEMARVCRKVNIYAFCSLLQVPQYLDFARKHKLNFDILAWHKTNAIPACNNCYVHDTEYIIFMRESGVRVYGTMQTKRKYYVQPANVADKRKWGHPTPKPLNIVQNLVTNSTWEGDLVFDPFIGSGTTAVACMRTGRDFIGCELSPEYHRIAERRIAEEKSNLFFK